MTDTSLVYPYEFEGGKRAVASQVNANFEAVKVFANGINASLADIREAMSDLEKRPTREMFDVYYSFSSETPTGAYPLWTGETIVHCQSLYPQFWKKLNQLADRNAVPTVTSDAYEEKLEKYGQCAGFYIDTANGNVRLPKITRFISSIESLTELAQEENAGLPNITGTLRPYRMGEPSGAFYNKEYGSFYHTDSKDGSSSHAQWVTAFDASRSNALFGASDTVQVPSVKLCLYLQVANNVGEISEFNTDLVIEQMNEALDALKSAYEGYAADLRAAYQSVVNELADVSPIIKIENVTVSEDMFVSDGTYAGYPYRVNIPLEEASQTLVPSINFALSDIEDGNFAPVAEAVDGYIYLYAKNLPEGTIVIPNILLL